MRAIVWEGVKSGLTTGKKGVSQRARESQRKQCGIAGLEQAAPRHGNILVKGAHPAASPLWRFLPQLTEET